MTVAEMQPKSLSLTILTNRVILIGEFGKHSSLGIKQLCCAVRILFEAKNNGVIISP
jgi:hypothetical protein